MKRLKCINLSSPVYSLAGSTFSGLSFRRLPVTSEIGPSPFALHPPTLLLFQLIVCTLFLLGLTCRLGAQNTIVQRGMVREINSGNKPIPGVTILFEDAKSQVSDQAGRFRLVFQDKQPGDLIFLEEIRKRGYELVNEKDFDVLMISRSDKLEVDVILAVEGTVDAEKKKYYNVSDEALLASFNREEKALRTELQQAKITQQDYLNKLNALKRAFERQKSSLDALAENFARVNFDDVDSLYQEALELFQAGKIESCKEKLEDAELLKRTDRRLQERKRIKEGQEELARQEAENEKGIREDIEKLKLLVRTYLLNFELLKAETVYDQLIKLDSTDLEILWDAANFYREQYRYEKAFGLYRKIIEHPKTNDREKADAYGFLGDLHIQVGNYPDGLKAYEQFNHAYDTLRKAVPDNPSFKNNLAVSYEKLGYFYRRSGKIDTALTFFWKRSHLGEELCEDYPQNLELKQNLAFSYEKLGDTYTDLEEWDSALVYFRKQADLFEQLLQADPGNAQFKNGLAIAYTELGSIFTRIGPLDSIRVYYMADFFLTKELSEENPYDLEFRKNLAISYQQVGDLYGATGVLDTALVYYKRFHDLTKELHERYPRNLEFKNTFAISYFKLVLLYAELSDLKAAQSKFQEGTVLFEELQDYGFQNVDVDFKIGLAYSYWKLGDSYYKRKEMTEAGNYLKQAERHWSHLAEQFPYRSEFTRKVQLIKKRLDEIEK